MQKSAELVVINEARAVASKLLAEAIEHHKRCESARDAVTDKQDEALYEAWQAGIRLNKLKPLIGHGNWLAWLELNFCKPLGLTTPRMPQVYMKVDSDNPNAKRVSHLKFDTIRKHAIGFVPEKEKPRLQGDVKFQRSMDHLKVCNEWSRWKRRKDAGQIQSDPAEERRDFREMYEWMRSELYAGE